jgi:ABC-type Mn2+/Zn2+ transport system ATPase subunit
VQYPRTTRLALDALTCCVPIGIRMALVSPNGAGKSTFLKAVAGLLPCSGGTIQVYGQCVGVCHHRVAYLPQRSQIDWAFPISVQRFVLTGRYVHLGWLRWPGSHDHALVAATLDRLGLRGLATRQIGQLSGGQQQRALLARALVQEADLHLLDEPLTAVDMDTRALLSALFRELQRQGETLLVATHDQHQLEEDFDGALYLQDGRAIPPPPGAFVGRSVGDRR